MIENAVSVAIGKNRLNAEIAFHIAVRPTQKPFQCGYFVADWPHFESLYVIVFLLNVTHLLTSYWIVVI